jgi:hypothetical protein
MLFGHNSNVKVGDTTFHVQTEDRGVATALIDTTVYYMGRVMHRRTNNYHDLVPLNPDREEALRLRLNEQHRSTLEDIRTGALHLAAPPQGVKPATAAAQAAQVSPDPPAGTAVAVRAAGQPAASGLPPERTSDPLSATVKLELCNARAWLSGKQARLEIVVATPTGQPLAGARVVAYVEGAAVVEQFAGETDAAGKTEITFAMPKLAGGPAALVIEAERNHGEPMSPARAHAKLRFALRTKPRPA